MVNDQPASPAPHITGLVLAGGLGTRMGGQDKGLLPYQGEPLARHALRRLAPQVHALALNANRNLDTYACWGVPIWPDARRGHPGPLAGMLVGMTHCATPLLATVPCDTPLFPHDLVARLAQTLASTQADIAMATAPEAARSPLRRQPVFCLLRTQLAPSLQAFLDAGGRRIAEWTGQHHTVLEAFNQPGDDPRAFHNANTPAELQALAVRTS
ncbi:MAG TPA: molybdenum cofactor guanylyltransferase MobA [Burkholderiaceae bacterium]